MPQPFPVKSPRKLIEVALPLDASVSVNASTAKLRLVQIAEEIISPLHTDPNAEVNVTVEIQAIFPNGAPDQIKRSVSENANTVGFKNKTWE